MHTQVVTSASGFKVGAYALGSAITGPLAQAHGSRSALWFVVACEVLAVASGAAALDRPVLRRRFLRFSTARPLREDGRPALEEGRDALPAGG